MKRKYWVLFISLMAFAPGIVLGDLSNKQLENLINSQAALKVDKAAVVKAMGNPSSDNTLLSEKGLRKVVSKFLTYSTLPPVSVDSQVALFKGTTGKMLKAAQGSGMVKLSSGVLGYGVAGTDYVLPSGNVATATALAVNGTNCGAGQAAAGVNASGNSEGCFTPAGTYVLPITDSVVTTSSTTAASATAVKAAYDLASGKLSPTGSAALLTGFPTLNQSTTGTAAGLTGTPSITVNTLTATTGTMGAATIVSPGASSVLTIGGNSGANNSAVIPFKTGSTVYGWQIGAQYNVSGFEITPSTAAGGTTYSTPAIQILPTGAVTIPGALSTASLSGSAITNSTSTTSSTTAASATAVKAAYDLAATKGTGTVTAVTGTAPVVSSGGTTPAISMPAATASAHGYMTSVYAAKLDGIASGSTANAKISGATLDSLADDTGFVTAKAIQDGHYVPHAAPGPSGNLIQSTGTDWASVAVPIWNQNTTGSAASATGDTVGWTDYSATSAVVGWSSFTTKSIYYKRLGKTVFISYWIQGTSNSATTTFTMPNTSSNTIRFAASGLATDNGVGSAGGGLVQVLPNDNVVNLFKDMSGTVFTASGAKTCRGQLWYDIP